MSIERRLRQLEQKSQGVILLECLTDEELDSRIELYKALVDTFKEIDAIIKNGKEVPIELRNRINQLIKERNCLLPIAGLGVAYSMNMFDKSTHVGSRICQNLTFKIG